ncbi:hypothetical protein AK830_g5857 [Neonectria ditissima]|uniref:DNA ligase D 3'-phosphoesterase domain-containing protein n=1 Tax=Neonectria ditissima TaxID=78410 RepID=A0A0P7BI72_9HYPO|nr:hypothetical protein AK830_g5857 [Neonectria ditissima]
MKLLAKLSSRTVVFHIVNLRIFLLIMSGKRPPSPQLIPNPFIKKRNLEWTLTPPHPSVATTSSAPSKASASLANATETAAIEAGSIEIDGHLSHSTSRLAAHVIAAPWPPPLSISAYASLYAAAAGNPRGAHFVIHQHDHPIAGIHYDLRLQINETSSASWAIMYGLPGNPNSVRLNRNATETRVHCLWNHLIETASTATGSLLIWDTGTYTVLSRKSKHAPSSDPSSPTSSPQSSPAHATPNPPYAPTPQDLLHTAFQNRKIRLRLHGSRLPDPYVVNLRLTKSEDVAGRARSTRTPRAQRRHRTQAGVPKPQPETSDEEDGGDEGTYDAEDVISSAQRADPEEKLSTMEREIREVEDENVQRTNAYPGAENTIGSVHQRRWYLSLDRRACNLTMRGTQGRSKWEPDQNRGTKMGDGERVDHRTTTGTEDSADVGSGRLSFPFFVRGADHERSVVTGRCGSDILRDEHVQNFVPRKGWSAVLN